MQTLTPYEIMEKLVSFPTVSRDSNLPLVDWVEAYLTGHGIICHRYYREDNAQAALFAHVGPEVEGGVILSGHTDVVPVDGQPWTSDPFTVVERDGKYFGRGCCDMKGFDALALWALVEAKKSGVVRPLQIALSFDEEVGCTGAPPMIRAMQGPLPKASAVIVGEPSMMQAVTGHKGGIGLATRVVGFEVHSSIAHTGVSAVMQGARLIDWANKVNQENMAKTPDAMAAQFEPPWTNAHVGTVTGGTANNITAKDCEFVMGFRMVPSESGDMWRARYDEEVRRVEAEMQAVHPSARIEVDELFDVPGLKPEAESEAEALVRRITGDNASHVVSYGTEAGQFQEAGYSAVICGPGNIEQAHQPDEFITVAQFNAGHRFMERLLETLKEG
ncbi:acetylornithine deacetylase [Rhodobacteraceae bacterium D3-12]|nr:acetylornithine deacetylase [Rhodobacteraceae bacterium D3-12]